MSKAEVIFDSRLTGHDSGVEVQVAVREGRDIAVALIDNANCVLFEMNPHDAVAAARAILDRFESRQHLN